MNNKIIVLIAAAIISYAAPRAAAQTGAADTVKKIQIKVTNLHCGNDMPTIKKQLLNQEGIDEVSFTELSGETSVFTIAYHTAATSQEQIEKAVESTPGCDNKNETPYRVKRKKK